MFWERGRRGHDGTREGRAAMDASRRVTLNDPSHLLGQQCFEVLLTSLIFVQKLPQPLGDALLYNVQLVCSALWRCLFTLMIAHLTQQLMKSKEQLVYYSCTVNWTARKLNSSKFFCINSVAIYVSCIKGIVRYIKELLVLYIKIFLWNGGIALG